jgi:predicted dienelactone hydrolase
MLLHTLGPRAELRLMAWIMAAAMAVGSAFTTTTARASTVVVGSQSIPMTDASRQRNVVSEVWFEAAPSTPIESFSVAPPLQSFKLTVGAQPAPGQGRKPLIVISHGNWGTRYSYGWLATELVKAGYVVLSTTHPGTMFGDLRPEYRARLWERSQDISFALSQLLNDPAWKAQIDENRIGFAGHSFGGWTGVSLAGGIYDYARQLQACKDLNPKDQYCTGLINDFDPARPVADGRRSFKDERFKAFYLMASGMATGFDEASLKAISRPMLFDTARTDPVLSPSIGSSLFAKLIPSASETVRDVGHFTYVALCRPLIGRAALGQACEDPSGVDRAATHELVARDMLRFFKAKL